MRGKKYRSATKAVSFEDRLFEIVLWKSVRALRGIPEDAPRCDWVIVGEKFKHVGNCPMCLSRGRMSTETKFNIIKKGYGFVTLKDGTEAWLSTVAAVVLLLEELSQNQQLYFVDLVFTARGKKPKLLDRHIGLAAMDRLALDGHLSLGVASIIRNSVEGDNVLTVVVPFKEDTNGISDKEGRVESKDEDSNLRTPGTGKDGSAGNG